MVTPFGPWALTGATIRRERIIFKFTVLPLFLLQAIAMEEITKAAKTINVRPDVLVDDSFSW